MIKSVFLYISLFTICFAQDLTGRWVSINGSNSGYYAELFLVKNMDNSYAGHSYDTEEMGYCRHWLGATYYIETQRFTGIDEELISKSPQHEATDYQLKYEKGENGREYLIGTQTVSPLDERLPDVVEMTPPERLRYSMTRSQYTPQFIKYVKVSDDYQIYKDDMPLAMTPEEINFYKAAFEIVYEEDLLLDAKREQELHELTTILDWEREKTIETDSLLIRQLPKSPTESSIVEHSESVELSENQLDTVLPEVETITKKKASRSNQLLSHVKVKTQKVTLLIRDYGTVDNDSVTIFFNDKIIAENMRITAAAQEFELQLEDGKRNELVFVANNLGDIPPNTARITLIADDKRYNYKLFTDEKNNALILLENVASSSD